MLRLKHLLLALVLAVTMSTSAFADIFRYVDSNGVVHYTNRRARAKGNGWKRVLRTKASRSRARHHFKMPASAGTKDPSPERFSRYNSYIREAALIYHLPESFIRAVMTVESNFHAHVVSHAGAMGLMQLMPGTAARMGVTDPFEPRQNVLGGARYLRILANQFNGDMVLTLAAYNAGENAVIKYGGVPPYSETRRYVRRVLYHYYNLRTKQAPSGPLLASR